MQDLDQVVGAYRNDDKCKVDAGFYWNVDKWEIQTVSGRDGGLLPGKREEYVKLPASAMLVMAPLMGAAYVVFLPIAGFTILGNYLAKKTLTAMREGSAELASAIGPHWSPGEAYFLGTRRKKKTGEQKPASLENKVEDKKPELK